MTRTLTVPQTRMPIPSPAPAPPVSAARDGEKITRFEAQQLAQPPANTSGADTRLPKAGSQSPVPHPERSRYPIMERETSDGLKGGPGFLAIEPKAHFPGNSLKITGHPSLTS